MAGCHSTSNAHDITDFHFIKLVSQKQYGGRQHPGRTGDHTAEVLGWRGEERPSTLLVTRRLQYHHRRLQPECRKVRKSGRRLGRIKNKLAYRFKEGAQDIRGRFVNSTIRVILQILNHRDKIACIRKRRNHCNVLSRTVRWYEPASNSSRTGLRLRASRTLSP